MSQSSTSRVLGDPTKAHLVPVRELAHRYAPILEELASTRQPAIITRNGTPVAALVALDSSIISVLQDHVLLHAPQYVAAAKAAERDLATGQTRSGDEFLSALTQEHPPDVEIDVPSVENDVPSLGLPDLESIRSVVRSELADAFVRMVDLRMGASSSDIPEQVTVSVSPQQRR